MTLISDALYAYEYFVTCDEYF